MRFLRVTYEFMVKSGLRHILKRRLMVAALIGLITSLVCPYSLALYRDRTEIYKMFDVRGEYAPNSTDRRSGQKHDHNFFVRIDAPETPAAKEHGRGFAEVLVTSSKEMHVKEGFKHVRKLVRDLSPSALEKSVIIVMPTQTPEDRGSIFPVNWVAKEKLRAAAEENSQVIDNIRKHWGAEVVTDGPQQHAYRRLWVEKHRSEYRRLWEKSTKLNLAKQGIEGENKATAFPPYAYEKPDKGFPVEDDRSGGRSDGVPAFILTVDASQLESADRHWYQMIVMFRGGLSGLLSMVAIHVMETRAGRAAPGLASLLPAAMVATSFSAFYTKYDWELMEWYKTEGKTRHDIKMALLKVLNPEEYEYRKKYRESLLKRKVPTQKEARWEVNLLKQASLTSLMLFSYRSMMKWSDLLVSDGALTTVAASIAFKGPFREILWQERLRFDLEQVDRVRRGEIHPEEIPPNFKIMTASAAISMFQVFMETAGFISGPYVAGSRFILGAMAVAGSAFFVYMYEPKDINKSVREIERARDARELLADSSYQGRDSNRFLERKGSIENVRSWVRVAREGYYDWSREAFRAYTFPVRFVSRGFRPDKLYYRDHLHDQIQIFKRAEQEIGRVDPRKVSRGPETPAHAFDYYFQAGSTQHIYNPDLSNCMKVLDAIHASW